MKFHLPHFKRRDEKFSIHEPDANFIWNKNSERITKYQSQISLKALVKQEVKGSHTEGQFMWFEWLGLRGRRNVCQKRKWDERRWTEHLSGINWLQKQSSSIISSQRESSFYFRGKKKNIYIEEEICGRQEVRRVADQYSTVGHHVHHVSYPEPITRCIIHKWIPRSGRSFSLTFFSPSRLSHLFLSNITSPPLPSFLSSTFLSNFLYYKRQV